MGIKRPIQEEGFDEFPLKSPKQVNLGNEVTSFSQNLPEFEETQKTDNAGDDDEMYFKIQYDGDSDTSKDESGPAYISPFSPEYVDFHFPSRFIPQVQDTYPSLLEGPPRKQVPIGADYQALVPVWDPQAVVFDCDQKLMGDCVHVPAQESFLKSNDIASFVWKACTCPDQGSIRCGQQHLNEAREALKVTLGNEKFEKLGFSDMGEIVSEKWSEEDERIFHEVVYIGSASFGKKIWEDLSTAFPSRKMSELVSYYFNVFILRRRSVQNRSTYLDIDSDNDDWDESYWGSLGFEEEDEDSGGDSPLPVDNEDHAINDYVDNDDGNKDFKVGLDGNDGGLTNEWDPGYVSCKGKAWDDFFSMSPLKFVDLPSTGNVMEEIFGPCSKNNGAIP